MADTQISEGRRALILRSHTRGVLRGIALPKGRYYSKAYRAYIRRLLNKHTGPPAGLAELMSSHLMEDANRFGFTRLILDPAALEEAKKRREEKDRIISSATAAFEEELLPYSRHINYTNKAQLEIPNDLVPAVNLGSNTSVRDSLEPLKAAFKPEESSL